MEFRDRREDAAFRREVWDFLDAENLEPRTLEPRALRTIKGFRRSIKGDSVSDF